jgi:hypothetical protein
MILRLIWRLRQPHESYHRDLPITGPNALVGYRNDELHVDAQVIAGPLSG